MGMGGVPDDFEFQLLPDDHEQFEILMENALVRVPALETAQIRTTVNGPESFTPDNNFLLGETPEVRGLFVGAGFNSAGIASAGGAGRALAEWMVEGAPTEDLWPVDIRRFAPFNANPAWLKERVKETLGLHYAMPWPNRELASARPFRRSPLHDRLAAKGAVFGSKMGWERPNYFSTGPHDREIAYGFGRPNWLDACAAEQRAAREEVALFDLSSFAKFRFEGPDAQAALDELCANDVGLAVGDSVYTAMLNQRGGIEAEVTVAKLSPDAFMIVSGSGQSVRDADWIRRNIGERTRATLIDVTSAYAALGLMGRRSRALLAELTDQKLDDDAFPQGAVREIAIGFATALCARGSYVAELGYELFVPTEFALGVYDALQEAGARHGLKDAGYYAIDALRLEKGYRAWGRETGPDVTPLEAGLGFAIRETGEDFIGAGALASPNVAGRTRRLVSLLGPEPDAQMVWGGEMVLADGKPIGTVTSAAYGAALGGIVALAWIDAGERIDQGWLDARRITIDVAGEIMLLLAGLTPSGAAEAHLKPLRRVG